MTLIINPVLVVTANLCFDRTLWTDRFEAGTVSRPFRVAVTAGGKGVNVVRTLRDLGRTSRLVGLLPQGQGAELERLLAEEGTDLRAVPTGGSVRGATIIVESDGRATVLNEPGPRVGEPECEALLAALAEELGRQAGQLVSGAGGPWVVCSGSLPPGLPTDTYGRVTTLVHEYGGTVIVDAAREALAATLPFGPDAVTPNLAEAEGVLGGSLIEPSSHGGDVQGTARAARNAAAGLHALGARMAIVTAGSAGVAWAAAGDTQWQPSLEVVAVNPIGAGDSFVGGLATALAEGSDWPSAVRYANVVAAAAVEQPTAGRVDAARVTELTDTQAALR